MTRRVLALILMLLVASTASAEPPGWVSGGPDGGLVWRIQVETGARGRVLATTTSGHFLSEDAGDTWRRIWPTNATEAADGAGWAVLFHRGQIVRGTSRGIASSEDGRTWGTETDLGGRVVSLGLSAGKEPRLLACLFLAEDGGETPVAVVRETADGFTKPSVVSKGRLLPWVGSGEWLDVVVSSPAEPDAIRVFVRLLEPREETLVLGSDDGGESWSSWSIPYEVIDISFSRTDPKALLAVVRATKTVLDPGFFRSDDGGRSWKASPVDPRVDVLRTFLVHPATGELWLGTHGGGLLRRVDDRSREVGEDIENDVISAIVADPRHPRRLYVGTQVGLYRTDDDGKSWKRCSAGLAAAQCVGLLADGPRVVHLEFTSGPSVSDDGGRSWGAPDPAWVEDRGRLQDVLTGRGGTILTTSGMRGLQRCFLTSDAGRSWTEILGIEPDETIVGVGHEGTLYAGGPGLGLRRSRDGKTWEELVPRLQDQRDAVRFVYPRGRDEAVVVALGAVVVLDAARAKARKRFAYPDDLDLFYRTAWPDPGADALYLAGQSNVVYRLDLGTGAWTRVFGMDEHLTAVVGDPGRPDRRIAAFDTGTLLESVDSGKTWRPFEPSLPAWNLRHVVVTKDRKLVVSAAGGVHVLDLAARDGD